MAFAFPMTITGINPYPAFDQFVTVESAADYETDVGVDRWINRAGGGAAYDWVQATAASQPAAAADGLDFDNTNDYMRCASDTIAADLQAYIAASQNPNFAIAQYLDLTDGTGTPPGFNTDNTFWAITPKSGPGYLWANLLPSGRIRLAMRNTLNSTLVTFDLQPAGDIGPGTYEFGWHFHDATVDTLFEGVVIDSRAFDFSPLFTANNPFADAVCTIGALLVNNATIVSPFSGRFFTMGYKNAPAAALVLP